MNICRWTGNYIYCEGCIVESYIMRVLYYTCQSFPNKLLSAYKKQSSGLLNFAMCS